MVGFLLAVCLIPCTKVQAAVRYDVTKDGPAPVSGSDNEPDYSGVQKILNEINGADEEVIVYFPAGTYYLPKSLRVYSNTHIILDENATLVRIDDGVNNNILHNVDANGAMDQTGGYEMSHDITIEGGTWDGGDVSTSSKASDIVRFDHAENITVKNCNFTNVYDDHHLELIGVKNALVEGCTFKNFYYRKGYENNYMMAREALQLEAAWTDDINDPTKAWAKGSVLDGTACKSVVVTGCTFDNIPCCVGQHHFTEDGKHRNEDIEISKNRLTFKSSKKNGKTAITCYGMNNLKVVDNTIDGDYRFMIHIDAADDVLIKSNTISNGYQNGIMVDGGKKITISNNTVKNFKKHGISCGKGQVKSISKNKIQKVSENGICFYGGTVKDISKNTIKKAKKSGISVIGGKVGSKKSKKAGIINNTITDCGLNGITVSMKCSVSSVSQNKISKIKNNGISLSQDARVYWVIKNKIKNCGKSTVYDGLKVKAKRK